MVNHKKRHEKQKMIERTRVWYILFDGCHLMRRPVEHIKKFPFKSVTYERFYGKILDMLNPHVVGTAIK